MSEPPPGLCLGLSFPEGPFIPVRGRERQVRPREGHISGLPVSSVPSRPPGSPARQGASSVVGVVGRVPSGSAGTTFLRPVLGSWGCGLPPLPGGGACVCVCVCVSSPTCAVNTDPSTSQEQQGPYHPAQLVLTQEGGSRVTFAQPPAMGRGPGCARPGRAHLSPVRKLGG